MKMGAQPARSIRATAAVFAALLGIAAPGSAGAEPDRDAVGTRISPQVEGLVVRVHVREGETVKAGQALIEIDPTEHELRLRMAEAKIEAAKADIEIGEASRDLARRGFELLGAAAALEKDRAGFELKTAEAELRKRLAMLVIAEAEARMAELQLSRCHILAPVDGKVGSVRVRAGESVSKGEPVLLLTPDGE